MYRKCYTNKKVTFSKLSHKRLRLHIPDAANNVIPYEIHPVLMGQSKVLKAKRLSVAMKLCTGSLDTVADRIRYARLSAGLHQDTLAAKLGIDRITLLRYENGQVSEENMQVEWLVNIATVCGMEKYFCCSPYHVFIALNAGKQIKQFRKLKRLTQRQMADICGVAINTVKRWERNENKPPKSVWELVNSMIPMY